MVLIYPKARITVKSVDKKKKPYFRGGGAKIKLVYLLVLLLLGSWATARAEGCMGETCTFPIKPEVGNAISPLS
jgi:hypothetical protein